MSLVQDFLEADRKLLLLINGHELPADLHKTMIALTTANNSKYFFWIGVPALLLFFVLHFRKKGLPIILLTAALGGIADQFNYRIIKSLMFRLRPFSAIEEVVLRVPYGPQSSSFPSNHATTTMAIAVWFSYLFPRATPLWISISLVIGYSRVYVGVHYPSDVIAAWIIGAAMGGLMILATRKFLKLHQRHE